MKISFDVKVALGIKEHLKFSVYLLSLDRRLNPKWRMNIAAEIRTVCIGSFYMLFKCYISALLQ